MPIYGHTHQIWTKPKFNVSLMNPPLFNLYYRILCNLYKYSLIYVEMHNLNGHKNFKNSQNNLPMSFDLFFSENFLKNRTCKFSAKY